MIISVSEACSVVASILKEEHSTVTQYARQLINAEMLPKSKGRAVAGVSARHIIRLMVAVLLKPKFAQTAKTVSQYLDIIGAGVPKSAPESIKFSCEDYLVYMLRLIGDDDRKLNLDEKEDIIRSEFVASKIEFVTNWVEVSVSAANSSKRFKPSGTSHQHWPGFIKRSVTISGETLSLICADLDSERLFPSQDTQDSSS